MKQNDNITGKLRPEFPLRLLPRREWVRFVPLRPGGVLLIRRLANGTAQETKHGPDYKHVHFTRRALPDGADYACGGGPMKRDEKHTNTPLPDGRLLSQRGTHAPHGDDWLVDQLDEMDKAITALYKALVELQRLVRDAGGGDVRKG
jgi:hypothetical protein